MNHFFKTIVLLLIMLLLAPWAQAQAQLHGQVFGRNNDGSDEPLAGVSLVWLGTYVGTATDAEGKFSLRLIDGHNRLIVSFLGYTTDTVLVEHPDQFLVHRLTPGVSIDEVVLTATAAGSHFDRLNPIQTQHVSGNELRKAACCNLSESFETNASVDVSYTDAVTGAKQIQMLGLAGIYSQLQLENIPSMRGLASVFGLNYIPGSWMESIQISKGTASVTNGFESITGQINVELKKPWEDERAHVNIYGNSMGALELNANYALNVSPNVYTMLLVHGSHMGQRADHNDDGFIDDPLSTQYNVYNRWKYMGKNLETDFGLKYMNEQRLGGQMDYQRGAQQQLGSPYGFEVGTHRFEAYNKTGYIFEREATSVGFINSYTMHDHQSAYGQRLYNARQHNFYSNLIFYTYINNTNHNVSTGASLLLDAYTERLDSLDLSRTEWTPGVFAEYTYKLLEKFTLMGGVRLDRHNRYGCFVTPRAHVMYKPWEWLTLRTSVGKGYRSPSTVAENTSMLASNRRFVFDQQARMEEAWCMGLNVVQRYTIGKRTFSLSIDYYRTNFVNQYVVDIDQSATEVHFYNLDGPSYSNSFQVELNAQPLKGFDLVLAYRINDVKTTINQQLIDKPLVSRNKGIASLSYKTPLKKWQFDYTLQLHGGGRLPNMDGYPAELRRGSSFDPFVTMNAQITKLFRWFDVYIGVENLTSYTQPDPIIMATNPYDAHFDASQIWGPISGAKYYAGIRMTIWK